MKLAAAEIHYVRMSDGGVREQNPLAGLTTYVRTRGSEAVVGDSCKSSPMTAVSCMRRF